MKILCVLVCSVGLLAACGQKGPLYLPDETAPKAPLSACDAPDAPCREQKPPAPPAASPSPTTEYTAP